MSTAIGVVLYTVFIMWVGGDKMEAKDQAIILNDCVVETYDETAREITPGLD